jgi:hypothetical protein
MPYKLFLDDLREPRNVFPTTDDKEWVVVRNYDQFVATIESQGLPFIISFDHDLSLEHYPFMEPDGGVSSTRIIPYDRYTEKTGYHAAKYLTEYCFEKSLDLPKYYIHTANPVGRENIKSILESYEKFRVNYS